MDLQVATSPRSTVTFDPGIGAPVPDPLAAKALSGMERSMLEAYRRPAQTAVPAPVATPPADEYRERNPSLPRLRFRDVDHLPSMGKAYPPGTKIRYRPYTFGESVYVEESELDMRETYALICKGIECSGMDPMQLTLPDVLYLGLVRKFAALGSTKVNVTSTCPACGGVNRTPLDWALEFDNLEVPALPIRVPFTFGEHTFMPLTLAAYLDLLERNLETDFVSLMAAQCTSAPDFDAAVSIIRDMDDPSDIALLKEVDALLHHELRPITVTCPQQLQAVGEDEPGHTCEQRYPVALDDVSAAFVLPFPGGPQADPRRQITFGPARDQPA